MMAFGQLYFFSSANSSSNQTSHFLALLCTDCHAQFPNSIFSLSAFELEISQLVFLYVFPHLEFPFAVNLCLFRSTLSSLGFFCLHISAENFNGVFSQSSIVCFCRGSCVVLCQGHLKQAELCPWGDKRRLRHF